MIPALALTSCSTGLLRGHARHLEEKRIIAVLQSHEVEQKLLIKTAGNSVVVLRMRGLQRPRPKILAPQDKA